MSPWADIFWSVPRPVQSVDLQCTSSGLVVDLQWMVNSSCTHETHRIAQQAKRALVSGATVWLSWGYGRRSRARQLLALRSARCCFKETDSRQLR